MSIQNIWQLALCLFTVSLFTESILPDYKTYVRYALTQNEFIFKTWSHMPMSLSIKVTKENKPLLNKIIDGVSSKEQENRLLIKYNNKTNDVSLLLTNISRSDEGLYHISTSIYHAGGDVEETDNKWNVQLGVLEPGEIKQGNPGEDIMIIEYGKASTFLPRLYRNYQFIVVLKDSDCGISTMSSLYGRLRCERDKDSNKTSIVINNVTKNDTGLYRVETEGRLIQQCFLNITERYDGLTSVQSMIAASSTASPTSLPSNSESDLYYILPITAVAVFAILLFLSCLIWIQGRNAKSIHAVERHILEALDTASIAALSTLRRSPLTRSREEIWTSNSTYLGNTMANPAETLQYPNTSNDSTSSLTEGHNKVQDPDNGYHRLDVTDNMFDIGESRSSSNNVLAATAREVNLSTTISDASDRCQVISNTEAIYAEVKPLSSKHGKAGDLCMYGYQMVDVSCLDNRIDEIQEVKLDSESGTPN